MPHYRTEITIALLLMISLTGCSAVYEPKPVLTKLDQKTIVSSAAAMSANLINFSENHKTFTCLLPAPDATFSQQDSTRIQSPSLTQQSGSDSVSAMSTEGEMLGRTPVILFARDMMYRLCELEANYDVDKAVALQLYKKNFDSLHELMLEEIKMTKISLSSTFADENKSFVPTTSDPSSESASGSASDSSTTASGEDKSPTTKAGSCSKPVFKQLNYCITAGGIWTPS